MKLMMQERNWYYFSWSSTHNQKSVQEVRRAENFGGLGLAGGVASAMGEKERGRFGSRMS